MADNKSIISVKSNSRRKMEKPKRKTKKRMPSVSGSRPQTGLTSVSKQADEEPIKPIQFCSPCLREEKSSEAVSYCENCQENLCPACVRQHRKFPTMKDHVIRGKDGETVPMVPVKLAECTKHNGKALDMYCSDHDVVHCAACIAIDHRKCGQISYLPEVAKNISESQEFKEVCQSINRVKHELATSRVRRNEDNLRLVKEKEDATARIKYIRKQIDSYIDALEKKTMDKLEAEYKKYNKMVDDDIAVCDDVIAKLDDLSKQLTDNVALDDANRFIQMRRANQIVKLGERTVIMQTKAKGSEQIQFIPDSRISDVIRSLPALGSFASEQKLLRGSLVGQFDLKLSADISDCQLYGSDFLPDGRALVSDWENRKVKLLNKSYKVVDYLNLSGCPYSVCSINQNEGIVSITNKKALQFFTIDSRDKMAQGRVLKTSEFCRDIAYNNGKLYVICGLFKEDSPNQISVYNLDGSFIQNIVTDPSGENLFKRPLYIALNSIGNIFIGDEDKGVISLNENGEVIGVFEDSSCLKYPYGVTIVNNDQLFVCGFGSHNLIQVGRNLVLLGEVVPTDTGLRHPRSVCYDVHSQRILVTCKNTKFIRVYSLK